MAPSTELALELLPLERRGDGEGDREGHHHRECAKQHLRDGLRHVLVASEPCPGVPYQPEQVPEGGNDDIGNNGEGQREQPDACERDAVLVDAVRDERDEKQHDRKNESDGKAPLERLPAKGRPEPVHHPHVEALKREKVSAERWRRAEPRFQRDPVGVIRAAER